jgi:prolyl 4-hydroxylase
MNLYDFIVIRENVIPQKTIDFLLTLKNQESSLAAAGESTDSFTQNLSVRNTLWYPIPPNVNQNLKNCIVDCFNAHMSPIYECQIKNIENVQYLGYPVGGHYIEHNDSEQITEYGWKRIAPRDISLLFYLSDTFTGGEIEFTNLGLTLKPKKGMMIAFPSYHEFAHQVHPVKTGFRDCLVSWIETKKRIY